MFLFAVFFFLAPERGCTTICFLLAVVGTRYYKFQVSERTLGYSILPIAILQTAMPKPHKSLAT